MEHDNEDEIEYIEAKSLNRHARKIEPFNVKLNMFSSEYLDQLEKEVNQLKKPSFDKLKEKYINNTTTLINSNSQYVVSKQLFDNELQKPEIERNDAVITAHHYLKKSMDEQKCRLKQLEEKLVELSKRKSVYDVSEISMPKFGKKEHFDADYLKMFPLVGTDEDISIKDLFGMLAQFAEDCGLSENALKRAVLSRLRGQRAKVWVSYQNKSLKEAITSLSLLFDKNESPLKYANEIKNFTRNPNEDIKNCVQRLIGAVEKYLENKPNREKQVLKMEYIKDKLDKLLSPTALREVHKMIENKHQLGEEVSEKQLLTCIYKEDMFDKRTENNQNYIKLQNINVGNNTQEGIDFNENDDIDSLSDGLYDLELNAAEHKRPFEDVDSSQPSFKHARNDRKILHPVRRMDGSNPIVIGNQGKPLIRIGNPNPNNRWHNRNNQNNPSNTKFNQGGNPAYKTNQFRDLHARNAPLQQQSYQQNSRPQMRYNRSIDFDRYQNNTGYKTSYNGSNGNRNYKTNQQFNQYRNGSNPRGNTLQHNLQFRTDPTAIYQQITLKEMNSICLECPREDGQHQKYNCPKTTYFRQSTRPEKGT